MKHDNERIIDDENEENVIWVNDIKLDQSHKQKIILI